MKPPFTQSTSSRVLLSARKLNFVGILCLNTGMALVVGCQKKPTATPEKASAAPVAVSVITLTTSPAPVTKELPGRISAFRFAEVRARVDGIVLKRLFTEGAVVAEGQPLYLIDPAPYRAALDSAKASLARAEADAASAQLLFERNRDLSASNAISRQDYDNAVSALAGAKADVAVAEAAVRTREINLGYTTVSSPIAGRIGRSSVTEGAYVQQAQATLLATVQQLDQVYVDLSQSSVELLKLRQDVTNNRIQGSSDQAAATLVLEDGRAYHERGALQFSDVSVSTATGSVLLRAVFPNPDGTLLPGMFVRARLEMGSIPNALLVPQAAVSRDARGIATVFVVGEGNRAVPRVVSLDRTSGINWMVTSGVAAGDRVIVEGLQRIRPGAEVKISSPAAPPTSGQTATLGSAR